MIRGAFNVARILVPSWRRYYPIFDATSVWRLVGPVRGEQVVRVYSRELGREISLRRNTSDLDVALKILESHEYGFNTNFSPQLIIDAGANIGISSLFFAKRFPTATIHAIEPDPGNYSLLKSNCDGMRNIITHQAALWPHHTTLSVVDPTSQKWMFSFQENPFGGEIAAITVGDIVEQSKSEVIDILKMDIEGGEKALFENGAAKWLPLVNTIVIELHDRYVPGCSDAFYSAISTRKFDQELCGENVVIRFSDE